MAKQDSKESKVTRIKAGDNQRSKKVKSTKTVSTTAKSPRRERKRGPIGAFFGYFVGAWKELRQVHWPTRQATWSLTAAVLGFSAFFVAFILLLDAFFKFVFQQLLK